MMPLPRVLVAVALALACTPAGGGTLAAPPAPEPAASADGVHNKLCYQIMLKASAVFASGLLPSGAETATAAACLRAVRQAWLADIHDGDEAVSPDHCRRFLATARQERHMRLLFSQVQASADSELRAFFAPVFAGAAAGEQPFFCPVRTLHNRTTGDAAGPGEAMERRLDSWRQAGASLARECLRGVPALSLLFGAAVLAVAALGATVLAGSRQGATPGEAAATSVAAAGHPREGHLRANLAAKTRRRRHCSRTVDGASPLRQLQRGAAP